MCVSPPSARSSSARAGSPSRSLSAAPAPAALMLGTTTALLGSVVASLAVSGVLREGGWLWLAAPRGTGGLAGGAWLVGVVLTVAPVVAVGAVALVVSPALWGAVGTVAVVSVVAADVAVVAGALVPWRGGAGDQLTTFAAFGADRDRDLARRRARRPAGGRARCPRSGRRGRALWCGRCGRASRRCGAAS